MLIRIVKMTFDNAHINDFLGTFETNKGRISSFKGCSGVELLRDTTNPSIFFTYSKWESEKDLESYRSSELFNKVWSTVRVWFADKPEAWSVTLVA